MKNLIVFFLIFFGCKTIDISYRKENPVFLYKYDNHIYRYQINDNKDTIWFYISPYDLNRKKDKIFNNCDTVPNIFIKI